MKKSKEKPRVQQASWKYKLHIQTKAFYDIQLLANQIAGRFNRASGPETQLDPADIETLRAHRDSVKELEKGAMKALHNTLKEVPFYWDVLRKDDRFFGFGELISAVLLSNVDIEKAENVSKLWRFCGLATVPCQRCSECQMPLKQTRTGLMHAWQSKKTSTLDEFSEEDQDAKPAPKCPLAGSVVPESKSYSSSQREGKVTGEKLHYNNFIKSKLLGVFSLSIMNPTGPWRKKYDDYKHRRETDPRYSGGWGMSKMHRHRDAIRRTVKDALLEFWKAWREYEGLSVRPSYHEEKHGGHGYIKDAA